MNAGSRRNMLDNFTILSSHSEAPRIFPDANLCWYYNWSYRCEWNLGESADPWPSPLDTGSFPCWRPGCQTFLDGMKSAHNIHDPNSPVSLCVCCICCRRCFLSCIYIGETGRRLRVSADSAVFEPSSWVSRSWTFQLRLCTSCARFQKRLVYNQLFDNFKSLLSLVFNLLHSVAHLLSVLLFPTDQQELRFVMLYMWK